jgi:predicted small integral membrane protein
VIAIRYVKTAMVASAALFALLVTFNNLVDYGSNYEFVRHTLSMDTTFPGNALMGRAMTSPAIWTVAYWLIILTEASVGVTLAIGAFRLVLAINGPATAFNAAKTMTIVGVGLGFLLWFTGFTVGGGEWFAMWQSKVWNGLEAAFRFYMTLLALGIFVNQTDKD